MQTKKGVFLISFLFLSLSFIFYLKLFWPQESLLFTPDLGRSDIFHYNFSKRFLLSQELKKIHLPLWTNKLGGGVSIIGEGQTGIFNSINIITAYFLPPTLAFNLTYVLYTFICLSGAFALARFFKLSLFSSIFTAFVFSFSGFFIFHLTQTTIISSAVFVPWIFLFTLRIMKFSAFKDSLFLAFVTSQQLLFGHPQIMFITVIGSFSCALLLFFINKEKINIKIKKLSLVVLAFILGLSLAGIQLLPSWEYKNYSVRKNGLTFEDVTSNSLDFKSLLTFIHPFISGSPSDGSYLLYPNASWDIFWEKADYIGLLPLVLVAISLFTQKTLTISKLLLIFLLLISLLLAFGKYSPLFFLFYLPPFIFFHIPARFLILTNLSLSVLAGFGLERIKIKNSFLKIILLALAFVPSFIISWTYHLVLPASYVLKKPLSREFIQSTEGRIFQAGSSWPYMRTLLSRGWKDPSYYLFALNMVTAKQIYRF